MGLRPDGKMCVIREQIIEDDASGLTFQFEVKKTIRDGKEAEETVLRVFGSILPHGNRELFFDAAGDNDGAGTYISGACKPTWQTEIPAK